MVRVRVERDIPKYRQSLTIVTGTEENTPMGKGPMGIRIFCHAFQHRNSIYQFAKLLCFDIRAIGARAKNFAFHTRCMPRSAFAILYASLR